MANFALDKFIDDGIKCVCYTVVWEDSVISETEKFFEKFYNQSKYKSFAEEIAKLILVISNQYGAIDDFFRWEKNASALPPYPQAVNDIEEIIILDDFPLRLYCLRLSKSCIVLFNGNIKTDRTAQGGSTSMAFHEANIFAERILDAFKSKEFTFCPKERMILSEGGSDNIKDILL